MINGLVFLSCVFSCSLFSYEVTDKNTQNKVLVTPTTFRKFADFVLYDGVMLQQDFNPKEVFKGAIVFVKPDNLGRFFKYYHPKIKQRYILITSVGDISCPGKFKKYLDDQKIIAWLSRNPTVENHEKFYPIPIGMCSILGRACDNPKEKTLPEIEKFQNLLLERSHFLYLNFQIETNSSERQKVYNLFHHKSYCYSSPRVEMKEYFRDLKRSIFVLSPRGNGLDCFRTWESIYLGAIPIVRTSKLDPLFKGLPVVIVKNWENINAKFLERKFAEIESKAYSLKKLYIFYWKNLIKKILKKEGIERKKPFRDGR